MADGENIKDASARLLATATFTGGIGIALYKGFKESPGALKDIQNAVTGARSYELPRMMVNTPIEDQSRLLSEAFSALEDIASTPGQGADVASTGVGEILRRTYDRALYGTGIVADNERTKIVEELVNSSRSWGSAEAAIKKYEHQLGGMQGVYGAMREISGGTVRGSRGKEVSEVIRRLPNIEPDAFGRRGGYLRSAFEPGGQFWSERFGLRTQNFADEIPVAPASAVSKMAAERTFRRASGMQVNLGIRLSNRENKRAFQKGQVGLFNFKVGGQTDLQLPFKELQFGGSKSRWFVQIPTAVEHKGINFVASDHRGMSFSSVSHFAVPKIGPDGTRIGYEKVSWNEGLQIALYGDEKRGVEGLADRLHKLHGDSKAMRDLTFEWNEKVTGLFHRVTGSSRSMTQARMHSESILPLDRMMSQIFGEEAESGIDDLVKLSGELKKSGINVSALSSADPMANQFRFSLQDWASRWDAFGSDYPIERRYGSRVKPFTMADEAIEAMGQTPIGGVLPRGYGITQTALGRAEMEQMPQAVAYLSLKGTKHLGEEEAVISKRLAPMMRMRTVQKFEVLANTTQASQGEILKQGAVIGVDYRSGDTILAKGVDGMVEQRIIDARQVGNIVRMEVESQLPLQDQMKIMGYKAEVHQARHSISKEMIHEFGAGKSALKFQKDLEFLGSAKLMKGIPQEINKQMAEASWLIMMDRLRDAGVLRSGGKSKVQRQRLRKLAKQKTYTYKGGISKGYVNMDMLMYVRNEQYRDKVLRNRQKAGVRLAKRLNLKGEQESLGVGLELLRYAKKHGLDKEEMSLIGGAFYQQLVKSTGDSTQAKNLLEKVGLALSDIKALEASEGVLAMPTMHVEGYASFNHKWGRAGMDYRALNEIKAQQWGEAGDLIVGELARRVIPANDLVQMERAAMSVVGRADELSDQIERVTRIGDAQEALGKKDFIFDYGGKQVYVPGPSARGMQQFASEQGEVANMELRSAYDRYISSQKRLRDLPGAESEQFVQGAYENLQKKIHKEWGSSGSSRGKVVGSSGPVARRWLPKDPSQTLAHTFANIDEFAAAKDKVFTIGTTRETAGRMFRDLISKASPEERAFLEAQQEAFMKGEKIAGLGWRHPTHRPQSLMPTWLQLVEGKGEAAFFHSLKVKHGDRILDVSEAAGMKLDYDFDHMQLAIIADEKTKIATEKLLNDSRWRREFVEGLAIQNDLMEQVKSAAAKGVISSKEQMYVTGLQKLVGVKMETGIISNLVGEMRAAAAFQTGGREFKIASYLLAELEEAPISSKHGLYAGNISAKLKSFVRGEGTEVKGAMQEAWDTLLKKEIFQAGDIKYSRDEFIEKMREWIVKSEEQGHMAGWRNLARRGAQAQKGAEWDRLTQEKFARAVLDAQSGKGDLNSILMREMRMGPGSAIDKSRATADAVRRAADTAWAGLKKHWRYPVGGAAAAWGISAMFGGRDLKMPENDHSQQINQLGQGPGVSHIAPPSMNPNRIITAGGGDMPMGFGMHGESDYSVQQFRQLGAYGYENNSSVRIRDDRGAITPEFIQKIQRERYY